jgi:hypothetical protein
LTETVSNDYKGTFGRLKDDSNATVDGLTKTVVEIKEAAETASRETSAGNGDLSQRRGTGSEPRRGGGEHRFFPSEQRRFAR